MRGRRISHKSHVGSPSRGGCACSGRFDGWGHLAIARDLPLGRVRHAASGTHSGPPACTPQHVMPYLDYSPAFIRIVDFKIDPSGFFGNASDSHFTLCLESFSSITHHACSCDYDSNIFAAERPLVSPHLAQLASPGTAIPKTTGNHLR